MELMTAVSSERNTLKITEHSSQSSLLNLPPYTLQKLNKEGAKSAKHFDSKNAVIRKGTSERKTAKVRSIIPLMNVKNSYTRSSLTA